MSGLVFPHGLDAASFLRCYWQKKPLLLRSAVDPRQFALSPDEVAGLALQADVEARLIVAGAHGGTQVQEPPFASEDFTGLPTDNWTLLVNDVDKHLPELASFLDAFAFIPGWRFDDLMISVAAPGGGVGPHVDQYDVFLCQMQGHRRWRLGEVGEHEEVCIGGVRQVAPFAISEDLILQPGDVLYLPPGVPHDGVAEDICSTWSVGFRAPSRAELATDLGLSDGPVDDAIRYSDPDLELDESREGLIGSRALERFQALLGNEWRSDDAACVMRLGEYLTSPKLWLTPTEPERGIAKEALGKRLAAGETLCRHGMALFARAETAEGHRLFASGKTYRLANEQAALAALLCSKRYFTRADFGRLLDDDATIELLASLYNAGQLQLESDWEHDDDRLPG